MIFFRSGALALAGAFAILISAPLAADVTNDSRLGPLNEGGELRPSLPAAATASLSEGFEGVTFPPAGWITRNQSTTVGTNTNCWNRFTTTPWAPNSGSGHAGANFNCTTGTNTISGWLITSQLTAISNGDQVTFWTRRGTGTEFPDRLELRLCMDTTPDSCGAAGSTGATATDVGSFTTLLLSVNPTLVTGVYPSAFTQFTATISGLPSSGNGRVAFRYFVTNGGPSGANSDIISIDDVQVIPAVANYSATPASLTYSGFVGATTAAQNATIAAPGGNNVAVTFTGCTISGANASDFALAPAPAFPLNIAAGASVNLPVTFTAGAVGARTASLTCTTSNGTAVGGNFPIALNGTGLALNYTATPPTLTYTGVVGVASATQNANIAADAGNSGPVTFTSCTIGGANAGDFALSPAPGFPLNIAAGANVNLPVAFTAGAVGARSATLSCATSNGTAVGGSFPITLSGTGTAPNLAASPASGTTLNAQGTIGTSVGRVVTFTNTGSAAGSVTCSASAGFTVTPPTVSLPATTGVGSVTVSATSGSVGTVTGTLTCTRNDGGPSFVFPLSFAFVTPPSIPTIGAVALWALMGLMAGMGVLAGFRRRS
jgi:hypothetical protein